MVRPCFVLRLGAYSCALLENTVLLNRRRINCRDISKVIRLLQGIEKRLEPIEGALEV